MLKQTTDLDWLEALAQDCIANRLKLASGTSFTAGGHNGPYFDVETPVRNTAHWLITLSILYKHTQKPEYKEVANEFLSFLLNPEKYVWKDIFIHRQKGGKDWCNGVIGQAWVVEALNIAAETFENENAKAEAQRYAAIFRFDNSVAAWSKTDPASKKNSIDYTLNHQLWFAAAKLEAGGDAACDEVNHFLSALDKGGFRIREDGLICHLLYSGSLKGAMLRGRYKLLEKKSLKKVREKELGYHLFNLHPLARIYRIIPEHTFFRNPDFEKALKFSGSEVFIGCQEHNRYAFPYNSPAFELPLVTRIFKDYFDRDTIDILEQKLFKKQRELTYDSDTGLFSKGTDDPLTLTARTYEWILSRYYND